jgi:hypothetical protein
MLKSSNLYNKLAKPFSTVCTDPFYGLTSGPRPPKFSQADPKLDVESRLPKQFLQKKFEIFFLKYFVNNIFLKYFFENIFLNYFFLKYFLKYFMKTRSVAEHSTSLDNFEGSH